MATSPDSVTYPDQGYGILGPLPAYVINIQDVPGADPTGNDDSTFAINTALAGLPDDGGELVIAPGVYKVSGPLLAKSNTTISGVGTIKAAPVAEWTQNGEYWAVTNVNNDANSITDENIIVRDITIDYSDFPSASVGTRFCVYFRMARRVSCNNVRTVGGTDAFAYLACEEVVTSNPHSVGFSNCGVDHWEQTSSAALMGGYLESASTNQMVNFNPELTGASTGYTAVGFRMVGTEMKFTGAIPTAVQIEPLYAASSSVRDVVVSGCIFRNTRLIMRGNTSNVSITGNTFYTSGTGEVIGSYPFLGGSPTGFSIVGNMIFNPETSAPNAGVIRCQMDEAGVIGNTITGTAYAAQAIYRATYKPNVFGNRVDASIASSQTGLPGPVQAGLRVLNGSGNYISQEDASGTTGLRFYVQTDNTVVLSSTNAVGAERIWATLAARSSTSQFGFSIPVVMGDLLRISPATGLTAAGTTIGTALILASNFNEVTTTAAGTGVRLPSPAAQQVNGARIVVWNAGANTLNVYPMSSGQIDALGANNPDTIASGACKTYVALSATLYRIET